jgi:hypothetical protein
LVRKELKMAGKNLVMVVENRPIRHAVLEAGLAPSAVAVVDPIMAELINWRNAMHSAFLYAF